MSQVNAAPALRPQRQGCNDGARPPDDDSRVATFQPLARPRRRRRAVGV